MINYNQDFGKSLTYQGFLTFKSQIGVSFHSLIKNLRGSGYFRRRKRRVDQNCQKTIKTSKKY